MNNELESLWKERIQPDIFLKGPKENMKTRPRYFVSADVWTRDPPVNKNLSVRYLNEIFA